MKTIAYKPYCRPITAVRYPNAATRREILRKALDMLLLAASGMGLAAILLLIMVL